MLTFKSSERKSGLFEINSRVRLCQCSVVMVNTWAGSQPRNNIYGISAVRTRDESREAKNCLKHK